MDEQKGAIVTWHVFMGERLDDVDTLNKMLYHDCSKMMHKRHVAKAKIDHLKELKVKIADDVLHALDLLWEVFNQWSDTLDAESKEWWPEPVKAPAGAPLYLKLQIKFHRATLPYREILQNGNHGAPKACGAALGNLGIKRNQSLSADKRDQALRNVVQLFSSGTKPTILESTPASTIQHLNLRPGAVKCR